MLFRSKVISLNLKARRELEEMFAGDAAAFDTPGGTGADAGHAQAELGEQVRAVRGVISRAAAQVGVAPGFELVQHAQQPGRIA